MTLPRWDDPKLKAGTMIRTALWLVSEIGIGNSFTKEQHRQAFAGITQADRRLRNLRDYGWVIHTSAEDISLNPEEQRFVAMGRPVWERDGRKNDETAALTAKMRMAALAENDYQCVICGIAGGESYPDAPHINAILTVSRRSVTTADGSVRTMLVPECKRCRAGSEGEIADVPLLLAGINNLDAPDRAAFVRWSKSGRRLPLDRLWADFRRLPAAARNAIRNHLA